MSKYAQNSTTGNTCPWGSADGPADAFTLAAQKAAAKRQEAQDTVHASSVVIAHGVPDTGRALKSEDVKEPAASAPSTTRSAKSGAVPPTGRSTASAKVREAAVEKKMMSLIEQVLDKKVIELREELVAPKAALPASSVPSTARSATSVASSVARSAVSEEENAAVTMANKRAQIKKLSDASLGKFDADQSRVAYLEMQKSAAAARNKNRSGLTFDYAPEVRAAPAAPAPAAEVAAPAKAAKGKKVKVPKEPKEEVKAGYEALERYPALLKEINDLSGVRRDAPEGLTSNGKQKQAMKLSDASLGKFDADESRLAYLEMQKSAQEARNKNRSALCFGDDTASEKKGAGPVGHKDVTMAEKRERAKKLSDASLGKYDADASQIAYLDMQNTAAEMRNKNRVGQGIF